MSEQKPEKLTAIAPPQKKPANTKPLVQIESKLSEAQLEAIAAAGVMLGN